MITSWMFYAICVALLATAAALLFDRPVRDRGHSTRGIWVFMLVSALLWPAMMALLSYQAPSGSTSPLRGVSVTALARSESKNGIPETLIVQTPPLAGGVALPAVAPTSVSANRVALVMLLLAPLLLLGVLAVDGVRIARSRRRWRREVVDGTSVLVSEDFGPAIVGVWHPAIVLPEWALALPQAQRVILLKHEGEHLVRRDGAWLGLGFLGLVCAPWNVGLWWIMRRLRLAIELDCDQRVLAAGYDMEQYGALLLEIGRHRTGGSLLAAGFAERRSMLRTRIETFTCAAYRSSRRGRNALRFAMGIGLLVGACSLGPSRVTSNPATSRFVLAPNVADSITTDNDRFKPVGAAHDLPSAFRVTVTQPVGMGPARAPCGTSLIDDRDGTDLRLRAAQADWKQVAARIADGTASAGTGAVGYYSVRPVGRYGVDSTELLRVGCPAAPKMANLLNSTVAVGLDTTLQHRFHITLDTLRQSETRLDITFLADPTATTREYARNIAQFAWQQVGGAAGTLDTVTVQVAPPKGREIEFKGRTVRWFFYPHRDLGSP